MENKLFNSIKCVLEKSKDEKNIIKVNIEDKNVYIGSKYSVQRDIENFMNKIKHLNKETVFIIFGLAAGEHILHLLKETSQSNMILVLEPCEKIIEEFKNISYSRQILNNKRIRLESFSFSNLELFLNDYININNVNNIEILDFANYNKLYSIEYKYLWQVINKVINDYVMELNTSMYFSDQYFQSFITNIPVLVKSPTINCFKGMYSNKPAIIVSAGPSLSKNIDLLKKVKDNFIIIVGGRTLKSCLDIGVTPDFVCVVDPGQPSYEVIKDSLNSNVPIVVSELTNCNVVKEYRGKKIFFNDIYMNGITDKIFDIEIDGLYQGGSVAHICTSFAAYIGCNPIIFIGQDLAYTNNQYHADVATTDIDRSLDLVEYKGQVKVEDAGEDLKKLFGNKVDSTSSDNITEIFTEDIYGKPVLTSRSFLFYKELLEKLIKENENIKFINSTEGGSNILGTEVKELSKVIQENTDGIDNDINETLANFEKYKIANVKNYFEDVVEKIQLLCEKSEDAIGYADKMIDNYTGVKKYNINQLNKDLEEVDVVFSANMEKINVLRMLLMPQSSKIMMNFEFIGKIDETELEMGIRLAQKTKALYKEIRIAMEKALPELIKLVDILAGMAEEEEDELL